MVNNNCVYTFQNYGQDFITAECPYCGITNFFKGNGKALTKCDHFNRFEDSYHTPNNIAVFIFET
jgi:phage FluMu protein Com